MPHHLAQVNIARMKAPPDSPVMAEFFVAIDEINALAEQSEGFIWRLKTPAGDATEIRAYDDPLILFNLSVWESVEALRQYAYKTMHGKFFARREEWFTPMNNAHLALWWIPAGSVPDVIEARSRLNYLDKHGETSHAFTFRKLVAPPAV